MKAIIPINVTALRVSENDNNQIVGHYKGRVANFNQIPYESTDEKASTGATVVRTFESGDSALNPLGTGIHLHWELPDYFRKGVQTPDNPIVTFPQAPNRWMVTRYLTMYDATNETWGTPTSKSWIIESDYVSSGLEDDDDGVTRPAVPIPLEIESGKPYGYMGRVQYAENWEPNNVLDNPTSYLPAYQMEDGSDAYLTSIGFLGPTFSAFYPDCCSVFGFWDHFQDNGDIFPAITENQEIQFKVSYQVVGWIDGGINDPMNDIADTALQQYNDYVDQSNQKGTTIDKTPQDYYISVAQNNLGWQFNPDKIGFDTASNSFVSPDKTICNGVIQEIVWNMLSDSGNSYFLQNPDNINPIDQGAIWTDTVDVAVGNTPLQALSALLKNEMETQGEDAGDDDGKDVTNYEYLLDALQLNLLHDIENKSNKFIELEEALHSNGFSKHQGGLIWVVQQNPTDPNQQGAANNEVTLPLSLAEHLNELNKAQKDYDMGRAQVEEMRKQLYMDWFRYVNIYAGGINDPNIDINDLSDFLSHGYGEKSWNQGSHPGELVWVENAGKEVGVLSFKVDETSGSIVDVHHPKRYPRSKAHAVYRAFMAFKNEMRQYPQWSFFAVASNPFWMPTEPVAVIEGDKIEPIIRNGTDQYLLVRVNQQLFNSLAIAYNGNPFTVNASDVPAAATDILAMLSIPTSVPYQADVQALVEETWFLTPTFAEQIATVLADKGGTSNPATDHLANFILSLQSAQGGLSPLDYTAANTGLFENIREENHTPIANPVQPITTPMEISITFTNLENDGWAPHPIAWSAQQKNDALGDNRYDPFLPVSLVWDANFDPLQQDGNNDYESELLKNLFEMDTDAIDYKYTDSFTKNIAVPYTGSVLLSKNTAYSLTKQIENYANQYPNDQATIDILNGIADFYNSRKYMAQTMSGFNINQVLRSYIAQIPVQDLTKGSRDSISVDVNEAASSHAQDNWYDTSFNAQAPISEGTLAQENFGPLRAGFMSINSLKIVDVFGQIMEASTATLNHEDKTLKVVSAIPVSPNADDTPHQDKIYLPPRLVVPSRLQFRWLSAEHNDAVVGVSDDFVEMNAHPSTSPVFGWVVPNHLENSLFFYQADGAAVGSFGVEHNVLRYRTHAGNLDNPSDELSVDIGATGSPIVNPHLANFLWYINGKTPAFLADMMTAIANSNQFIDPANYAQNATLSVLVGRPLALTRAILGIETEGNLLPLSQAESQWSEDVNAGRSNYIDRMTTSAANLGAVTFPIRLGDLANLDDGLVGFLIEGSAPIYDTFYSPSAVEGQGNGVAVPLADTLEKTLNETPDCLTLLVDPRANVHATVGVLPVEELGIPYDQYSKGMQNLQMTFFTMPVLNERQQLRVPIPTENGYQWSWVKPGSEEAIPLKDQAANGNAIWDFTPQTAREGWLKLNQDTND